MIRHRFWLFVLLPLAALVLAQGPARAQPKPAPAAAPPVSISPEQARAVLDTLNDPKKRAAFAATLDALVKGQPELPTPLPPPPEPVPGKDAKPPAESGTIQLAPDSLGAQVLLAASSLLNDLADDSMAALNTVQSIPLLWAWGVVMLTNPIGQRLLWDAAWRLAVAMILAVGVELALRVLMRRPMAHVLSMGHRDPSPADADPTERAEQGDVEPPARPIGEDNFPRRLRLGLARFALEIVPVLGLLIAGHMVAASALGGNSDSRLIILAVTSAVAVSQTLLALQTWLFMAEPPGLRLADVSPAMGMYLMQWGRRLILIGVPGYTIGEVGLLLGMSKPSHVALRKAVGLVLLVCLAIMTVQRRQRVRAWLSASPDAEGGLARLRNRLARHWYWAALFFLGASWLSWTLRAPDAIARGLWYFAVTAAVAAAAAIARVAVTSWLGRLENGLREGPDHSVRVRLGAYHPAFRQLTRLLINLLAILALLQLYGLGGLTWLLTSDVGHRVASGLGTLAVTIGAAFAVWEGVNIAIQRHLETLRRDAQAARLARLRTLLPLVRTTLSITIAIVAGLMVLSEIGVNIAPLLAGAGIVGVAIGFGSQKLVQDVITGVFLLLENTMQVGDVVKVGDQSGLVESLSVRTIRLRTEDGSVVVIPFSAVTTVINMTRDFSRAVISLNVSASEDVDRVVDTMREIVREMRAEDAWSAIILDDLEVWGLDKFTDSALLIKCRIMCTPFGRWPVSREFNRRLKLRFQMIGVATPWSALRLLPVPDGVPSPPPTIPVSAQ
ncbi:MAG: mechanosensitive ion channel [Acetobacteraceae bacterium]|nr:mechanosensitive ion channel [Acetobacteraceae bacterium]